MEKRLIISVKEARKLLGKKYSQFSDEEIEEVIILLESIARGHVNNTVPKFQLSLDNI